MTDELGTARQRQTTYWIVGIGLTVGLLYGHGSGWRGGAQLHTVMEAIATLLALMVGAMALVRYYSNKEIIFLFIGAGFLGTGFLDGYHAIVTSAYFKPMMPSDLPALIPWSWVASRQFLSIFMILSLLACGREERLGAAGGVSERTVYVGTAIFTLASFLFFAFVPLPRAYYPEIFFHRPEEFGPALLLLLALIGYIKRGHWRHDAFEHWLVLSLIIGFIGQAVFMSHSGKLFDYEFDIAHTLKKVSYICVLIGLLISMYVVFRREEETVRELNAQKQALNEHAIVSIADVRGNITYANDKFCEISGYSLKELLGQNHRMLKSGEHSPEFYNDLWRTIANGKVWHGDIKNLKKGGGYYWVMATIVPFLNERGKPFQYVAIRTDITEGKEIDRMKSEFVSTVSHELRTPLTSIKGSLGMIVAGALGELPEKAKGMMDIAYKNTERLINLVNDILDTEKMESGIMEFHFNEVDISDLVRQSIEDNKGYAEEYGIEFLLKDAVPGAKVRADTGRINQVIANLLSNAAKFSPQGGRVEVSVAVHDDTIRVSVTDRGPGISKDFRNKIFGKFVQADSSDTRQKGGTGLGLNISRSIIEKHGGRIGFDTETDVGATFYFDLPGLAAGQDMTETASQAETGKGLRALICEDDHDVAKVLSAMLENDGFSVDIAYSAEEAKERLAVEHYDAMTVDIMLPDQDGLSLISELREQERTKNLAMVVVSAKAGQARQEALEIHMGIVDWLEKPIDQDRMVMAVHRAIQFKAGGKAKVLHVDDDMDLIGVTSAMLEGAANLIPATTLKEAKERLQNDRFDLVIIDIGLPDGSGLELLELVKDDGLRLTPVIIFSGQEVSKEVSSKVEAVLIKSRTSNEKLVEIIKSLIPARTEEA